MTEILEAARVLYENVKADIVNAKDRIEHIRLTALAQEAENLYFKIKDTTDGPTSTELTKEQIEENLRYGPAHPYTRKPH
jgi:hypothetical protein